MEEFPRWKQSSKVVKLQTIKKLNKQEPLVDVLSEEMDKHLKGEKIFTSSYNDWPIELDAKWSTKKVHLKMSAKVPKFHIIFENCTIRKAKLMSIVAGYDNYKLSGGSSPISDVFVTSASAKNLLKGKNASFELSHKHLIYEIQLKRTDKTSLTNVFILFNRLTQEINELIRN